MGEMDERLKQLFDYTKFHIGMYTTLIGAIIAIFGNKDWALSYRALLPWALFSVMAFTFVGIFGGLVASSIPYYRTFPEFADGWLGPWRARWVKGLTCTHLEHSAFWAGCAIAIVGIFYVMVPTLWTNFTESALVKAATPSRIEEFKGRCDLYGHVRGTPQHADCVRILDSQANGCG
jgi:hypothetical protein